MAAEEIRNLSVGFSLDSAEFSRGLVVPPTSRPVLEVMDVSAYLGRDYGPLGCWPLVAHVMHDHYGEAVTGFKGDGSMDDLASTFRITLHRARHFSRLAQPTDLCMVLMGSGTALGLHHCGIYWQGSVLHALPGGNRLDDLWVIRDTFCELEFWGRS